MRKRRRSPWANFATKAKQLVQDALAVADAANDVAVVRKIKPLLARVSDVEQDIEGRIRAQGQP